MSQRNGKKGSKSLDELKQQLEGQEIIYKAELLELRCKIAKEIEQVKKQAKQDYLREVIQIKREKEELKNKAKINYESLLEEISKLEEEILSKIKVNFDEKKEDVINDLIKSILP